MKSAIKLRSDLFDDPRTIVISQTTGISIEHTIGVLYRLANWVHVHGKNGIVYGELTTIDQFVNVPGFGAALNKIGWVHVRSGSGMMLATFTNVSFARKGVGSKLRQKVLHKNACCAVCGSTDRLQIDHKVPVSKGGRNKLSNLQALCEKCNSRKGTKTMGEFMPIRRAHA